MPTDSYSTSERTIAEAKKEVYKEQLMQQQNQSQQQKNGKGIFEQYGLFLLIGGFVAYWLKFFDLNYFAAYCLIIVGYGLWEIGKQFLKPKTFQYRPFKLEELPELEDSILRHTGRRIDLHSYRMLGEPETGEGSAEPYTMHFWGTEEKNGMKKDVQVTISLRTPKERGFVRIEGNHSHIETDKLYWNGNLKPHIPTPPPTQTIYMAVPTGITAEIPTEEDEEETKKEEKKK